jgi:GntR family transcriptional regulator/MocR family aminotransferase
VIIRLDDRGARYAQITRAVCALIQSGTLAPGARLPPTRQLARDLGCSRNLALLAYEQLTLEGYLVARRGGGTYVSPDLPAGSNGGTPSASPRRSPVSARLARPGRRLVDVVSRARRSTRLLRAPIDFIYGLCQPDVRTATRVRGAFAASLREARFGYSDPAGDLDLRRHVAERLRGMRGIDRPASQIVITSGAQQALDICARLLVAPGDRVAIEDPGYEAADAAFAAAGARLVRVRVDDQGLDVSLLGRRAVGPRLVYVTPSHQFPTGAVMSAARRYQAIDWAARHRAWIVEDDYDGEFRYEGRSIPALAALDTGDRVIYCGTFSKSLFPALRLGYLALPPALVEPAAHAKWLCDRGGSALVQRTMALLMASGEYDRHIRRMTWRYRARRDALVDAVDRHLGSAATVVGSDAGLHIVVWLPALPASRVEALIATTRRKGVGVYSVAAHASRPLRHGGLLLGYGLTEPPQIEEGVRQLAAAYREVRGATSD